MHQVMVHFGDVEGFLRNEDVSSITSSKLLEIMCDVQKQLTLQLELAAATLFRGCREGLLSFI